MHTHSNTKKLRDYFTLNVILVVALTLGLLAGWSDVAWINKVAQVVSEIVINFLKLLSLPLIFLSVVSTISNMGSLEETRSLGLRVVKYTLLTTILAATIALILFVLIDPVQSSAAISTTAAATADAAQGSPSYLTALLKMFPSNLVKTFSENNVMGGVFIAILLGLATLSLPEKEKGVLQSTFHSLFTAVLKIAQWLIRIMPIGVWAFVTLFIQEMKTNNSMHLSNLFLYISVVVGANIIQGVVILPIILKIKRISPLRTFKGMFTALNVAFFSRSSAASLPIVMKCAEENLNIPRKITSFSLPLCCTINMNGCAAFIITTVLFVSMSNGMTYTPLEMVLWILIATVAAIGNAGIPMGCYFLSSAFLAAMDVPLHILGLILPIYTIIDMIETALNVWSDSCVAVIVNQDVREEERIAEAAANA